jgi:hypothetical protein
MTKPFLGELLIKDGAITKDQLDKAMDVQKKEGGLIGIILVNLGYINEQTLVKYLGLQAESVVKL